MLEGAPLPELVRIDARTPGAVPSPSNRDLVHTSMNASRLHGSPREGRKARFAVPIRASFLGLLIAVASLGCQRESGAPAKAGSPSDAASRIPDADAIVGSWKIESAGDPATIGSVITVSPTELRYQSAKVKAGAEALVGTYKLNAAVSPKEIDWKFSGLRPTIGIYELDGDTLRIYVNEDVTSLERPVRFPVGGGAKGLMILRRQKS
jgi:uncharacterized protein (TIGR03067 family)